VVSGIVQQAILDHELPAHSSDAFNLSVAPWALCVGTNTLERTEGLLSAFGGSTDPLQRYRHLHMLLNGMQWQPLQSIDDRAGLTKQIVKLHTLLEPFFQCENTA